MPKKCPETIEERKDGTWVTGVSYSLIYAKHIEQKLEMLRDKINQICDFLATLE